MKPYLSVPLTCILAICLSMPRAMAQETSAGITGTITDPSGASIVGATLKVKDVDRGTAWQTTTNADGIFAFPRLPAGKYEVTVEAVGFATAIRRGLELEINDRMRLDVRLELGAVTQAVEVSGAALALQTENTQVGTVISGTTNVNLPLNGRNFVQLTLLTPGATTVNPNGFENGQRTTSGGRPYVNGNREEANNFLLDGIDNNMATSNMTSYQPNVDAIQEFKMITNNAPAEFGNFQGAIVNVTIKSGTNQFHGTVFEFLRNDKLNANAWARNWRGLSRAPIRHNVFGGTVGGRIIRDRLFFFADYQGIRRANPGAPADYSVFPMEFRQGDFSRLLSENRVQLYDPLTTDASGVRLPFPNNHIPQSMMNVVARNLFANTRLYPAPLNPKLRFNTLNTASSYVYTDQGDVKIDAKLTSRDDFSARYSNSRQDVPTKNTLPLALNTFFISPFQAGVLNWTRTISASMVNEARAGVNRIMFSDGSLDNGIGNAAEQLGILNGNDRGPGLMAIDFQGGLATSLGNQNVGRRRVNYLNTFHYAENLTIMRGRHLMKTGFQFLRQQANIYIAGGSGRTGFIRFTGQYTSGPNANRPASSGLADADFVLGYPTRLGRGPSTGTWGHRKSIFGGYFQDDWRVSNSLTLNLGLRWEYHSPFVEVADRQTNFEPFTGRVLYAGRDGASRSLYDGYRRDFQPRLGFAWTPGFLGKRTVIRGAYTISSFMEGMGAGQRLPLNPPWVFDQLAIYEGQTRIGSRTEQGFSVLSPTDPWQGAILYLWDRDLRPASSQQWSFILERQLPMSAILTLGYVGQHGTHLAMAQRASQRRLLPDGKTAPSPYLAGNPDLVRVIAQINNTTSSANQRYDALQTALRRRFSAGAEFQLSYTWSKGMSDSRGYYGEGGGQASSPPGVSQNLYNRHAEWGPAYFDAAHIFNFYGSYQIPVGRGKSMGGNWRPALDRIAGQWQVSGILTLRSGFPLTLSALDRSGTGGGAPRPDRIADGAGPKQVGPGTAWFDTKAFRQPVAGTFGSCGVGVVRGPGVRGADVSLQKTIPVTETKRFEFRVEIFNLTNTPNFNAPVVNVNAVNFGEITSAQKERNIQLALKFYY